MPTPIVLKIDDLEFRGEFNDTPAGREIGGSLPITCHWSRWGEEYYGSTSPAFGDYPGEMTDLMEVGDLAYHGGNDWFCLFFGPTPASRGDEPRAAAPLLKVGRVDGDWAALSALGYSVTGVIEAV